MQLTPKQIGLIIYDVGIWGPGGSKEQVEHFLDVAIAVCLSESGGNTRAKNPSSSASGLWQIMVSVHEDLISQQSEYWWAEDGWPGKNTDAPKGYRKPDIWDPRVNTSCAAQIWHDAGNKWTPWEVFTTGEYKKNLGHGKEVYAYLNSPAQVQKDLAALREEIKLGRETFETGADIINALNPAETLNPSNLLDKALSFLQEAGVTIGVFLIALILVVLGMWLLLDKPLPPVATAVKKLAT